jgi:uncharacterized protein (DUF2235 family)
MRNLIVCCDGTGNEYCEDNSNVVKLFQSLRREPNQIAFYDPGVGTILSDRDRTLLSKFISKTLDLATGRSLQKNVQEAYTWMMNNYEDGDQVFLFGFSRGAHTVRRLASVVDSCGLLYPGNRNMVPYVSKMYLENYLNGKNKAVVKGFKDTYSRSCPIHFLGVWDTVSALTTRWKKASLDGELHPGIKNAFHAISIDEGRKKFPVNLWIEPAPGNGQTVEQVWFRGVHSDVGGSYHDAGLSDIALIWMIENAKKHGLLVKSDYSSGLRPNPSAKAHQSREGLWKIWPTYVREMPVNSKVHNSVKQYRATASGYRPKNLEMIISSVSWSE